METIGKYCSLYVRRNKWFHMVIKFEVTNVGMFEGNQYYVNLLFDAIKKLRMIYNSFFGSIAKLYVLQYILYYILNYDR